MRFTSNCARWAKARDEFLLIATTLRAWQLNYSPHLALAKKTGNAFCYEFLICAFSISIKRTFVYLYILFFFLAHWFLSLFCQTFFLHRYASHKMFTMHPFWERFFYFLTFLTQGSSFLNPRAYAILHRMHHAYSDTEEDPHSPHFFKDVWQMTMHTKDIYLDYAKHNITPKKAFDGDFPEWKIVDKISDMWIMRLLFVALYILFYLKFATAWWMFLLLPIHFFMGPIHGAIVNWVGHKYGYSNYDNGDKSKNSLPVDVFLMGELMQNNHHKSPNSANFARKKFEIDPAFIIISMFGKLGIIKIRKK